MTAQCIDPATGATHIAEQELQYGRRADDLRAKGVLRPANGIDDGGGSFHITIFAHRGEEVCGFDKLLPGNACNALDHFRGVA
jgi:hypothetical protein